MDEILEKLYNMNEPTDSEWAIIEDAILNNEFEDITDEYLKEYNNT